ncbi:5-formyltetrahydrofolate cyclo-ligase [Novosphingobium sp. Gsoil 351]|uniref:5-formyltetrahydrofolate cyclo-ligase n=1 Tax=Novosphingobium sp. Gsoil 351 TaxID=2675225 RepID=UPI0012B482C3|nr:5-formyltetrahydrofolate cyclo-ligase [Novosphingobium sp. Gsoil 351]QGN53430.1 5-formyltetrahydrofolate cyclo-ligase [Novosphingobium sp. Gsoil 351]
MDDKAALRARLRAARREHVAGLPDAVRGLLFRRPPRPVEALIPSGAVIGVYSETPEEAPASGYARWFFENGHTVALPWFADRASPMAFRGWDNPFLDENLEAGPWRVRQPAAGSPVVPDVVFVPLVGFTGDGARLGMGAGHYDRWLETHPDALAIGLAWDCQEVPALPLEPHDRPLAAIVTPTRLIGPFDRALAA